jgi:hypothetical protein
MIGSDSQAVAKKISAELSICAEVTPQLALMSAFPESDAPAAVTL